MSWLRTGRRIRGRAGRGQGLRRLLHSQGVDRRSSGSPSSRWTSSARRIDLLRDRFRRIRGARLTWSEPDEAALEALLSRGDRAWRATIERAHDLGAVLRRLERPGSSLEAWRQAIAETGVDLGRELGEKPLDAVLPWDVLDAGIRRSYLRAEWRRALKELETEDCKWGHCYRCGIPGNGEDTQLAPSSLPIIGQPLAEEDRPKAAAYRLRPEPRTPPRRPPVSQPPVFKRYRVTYSKTGDVRFLSHRQTMDALERALRAAGAPVRYTEGYNPHVRLSMGPALALGHQGEAEPFDVDCTAPLTPSHCATASRLLPDGLDLVDSRDLLPGASSLGKTARASRYVIGPLPVDSVPATAAELPEDVAAGVRRWQPDPDGTMTVELNLRQADGPTPTVKQLLAALGVPTEEISQVPVTREAVLLGPPRRKTQAAGAA